MIKFFVCKKREQMFELLEETHFIILQVFEKSNQEGDIKK